jgi:hypothetical protein
MLLAIQTAQAAALTETPILETASASVGLHSTDTPASGLQSTDITAAFHADGTTWRAASGLRAHGGAAFMPPVGPIARLVMQKLHERSYHCAEHPLWIDRSLRLQCLHVNADKSSASFFRHHALVFAPLLQLTRLLDAASMHVERCPQKSRQTCIGCRLEMEYQEWVIQRVASSKVDPALLAADQFTCHELPVRLQRYAEAVDPILASMPRSTAIRLARLVGIKARIETEAEPEVNSLDRDATGGNVAWASLWAQAQVPETAALWNVTRVPPISPADGTQTLLQPHHVLGNALESCSASAQDNRLKSSLAAPLTDTLAAPT